MLPTEGDEQADAHADEPQCPLAAVRLAHGHDLCGYQGGHDVPEDDEHKTKAGEGKEAHVLWELQQLGQCLVERNGEKCRRGKQNLKIEARDTRSIYLTPYKT